MFNSSFGKNRKMELHRILYELKSLSRESELNNISNPEAAVNSILGDYPDLNATDDNGNNILLSAIRGQINKVLLLPIIKKYNDTSCKNNKRTTPLISALLRSYHSDIILALLRKDKSSYADGKCCFPYVPLNVALAKNYPENVICELIDKYGVSSDCDSSLMWGWGGGTTSLHLALKKHYALDLIYILMQKAPKAIEQCESDTNLPLHFALRYKYSSKLIKFLVTKYPNGVNFEDSNGLTPVQIAIVNDYDPDIIRFLLQNCDYLPYHTSPDKIAIVEAFSKKLDSDIIHSILDKGRPFYAQEKHFEKLFKIAVQFNHKPHIETLIKWYVLKGRGFINVPEDLQCYYDDCQSELNRMKIYHVSEDATLYEVAADSSLMKSMPMIAAERVLSLISGSNYPFLQELLWTALACPAYCIRLQAGSVQLDWDSSQKVIAYLSFPDYSNLVLAHRPNLCW